MKTEMNFTGQKIKFENGKVFAIFSKLTKAGVRYFYYSRMQMRYFPISELNINKYICLED
jgi:hypothetical protein